MAEEERRKRKQMPKEIRAHERKFLNILFKKIEREKEIDLALSKGMICHLKFQSKNER